MKLNHLNKILILSLATIIIVLILGVFFANLLSDKIMSINNKIKQLDMVSQELERSLKSEVSIDSSLLEREKLAGYFVGSSNASIVEFTEYLEGIAKDFGVTHKKTLNYESINELQSSELVSALRFKFNITGKWADVFNFLQAIENLPKVARLNSASLSVNSEISFSEKSKPTNIIWSADLDFTVASIK